MLNIRHFDSDAALATAVVETVTAALQAGIASRGCASLVIPGGTTPPLYLPSLAEAALDWKSVTITLSDERWVDPTNAASNEGMVRRLLLKGRATAATFVPLKIATPTPHQAVAEVAQSLASIAHPYDCVLLGMGEDGHFASLFSDAPETAEGLSPTNLSRCLGTTPASSPVPRMSLTFNELMQHRHCIVHFKGERKMAILEQAIAARNAKKWPVNMLAVTPHSIDVFWTA